MAKINKQKPQSLQLFSKLEEFENFDKKHKKSQKLFEKTKLKSRAANCQFQIHQNLLEARILLQRGFENLNDEHLSSILESSNLLKSHCELAHESDNDADDLDERLQQDFEGFRPLWEVILTENSKKLALHSGAQSHKFQVVDRGLWSQISATLAHETLTNKDNDDTFDDTKLYKHLLQDLVSANQANVSTDSLSRSVGRKKAGVKKAKTNSAKGGRRIKYIVHDKLTNFTFPRSRSEQEDEEEIDLWFKSLLGGSKKNKR